MQGAGFQYSTTCHGVGRSSGWSTLSAGTEGTLVPSTRQMGQQTARKAPGSYIMTAIMGNTLVILRYYLTLSFIIWGKKCRDGI